LVGNRLVGLCLRWFHVGADPKMVMKLASRPN